MCICVFFMSSLYCLISLFVLALSYVQMLVCNMCRFEHVFSRFTYVICSGFSICFLQFAATNLGASLRANLASLGLAQFMLCAVFSSCVAMRDS